jgi:hypothetical protein
MTLLLPVVSISYDRLNGPFGFLPFTTDSRWWSYDRLGPVCKGRGSGAIWLQTTHIDFREEGIFGVQLQLNYVWVNHPEDGIRANVFGT